MPAFEPSRGALPTILFFFAAFFFFFVGRKLLYPYRPRGMATFAFFYLLVWLLYEAIRQEPWWKGNVPKIAMVLFNPCPTDKPWLSFVYILLGTTVFIFRHFGHVDLRELEAFDLTSVLDWKDREEVRKGREEKQTVRGGSGMSVGVSSAWLGSIASARLGMPPPVDEAQQVDGTHSFNHFARRHRVDEAQQADGTVEEAKEVSHTPRFSDENQTTPRLTEQIRGASSKKREALARQLAINIEALADACCGHPVLVGLNRAKGIRQLRQEILRLLKVTHAGGGNDLSFALVRSNIARLLTFGTNEMLSFVRSKTSILTVDAKGALLDALQKNESLLLRFDVQEWVQKLLTSETGSNLMILKNICDGGGDYNTLHKLIFQDIKDASLRDDVLKYFDQHAAHRPEGTEDNAEDGPLKVVSDIDDTITCSGGHWPKGCDKRYPPATVYPGILRLYIELDRQVKIAKAVKHLSKKWLHRHHDPASDSDCSLIGLQCYFCNLVFISARPHIYKDWSERMTYNMFRQLQEDGMIYAMPTLIPGGLVSSVSSCAKSLLRSRAPWTAMGDKKFQDMQDLRRLYPGYSFCFFGDNGQGDVVAAEKALSARPKLIQIAFIHEVQERSKTTSSLREQGESREAKWRELDIHFVKSPVEAAIICETRGLINKDSLEQVCQAAIDDIEALAIRHPEFDHWIARCMELNVSFESVPLDPKPQIDIQGLRKELDQISQARKQSLWTTVVGAADMEGGPLGRSSQNPLLPAA